MWRSIRLTVGKASLINMVSFLLKFPPANLGQLAFFFSLFSPSVQGSISDFTQETLEVKTNLSFQ